MGSDEVLEAAAERGRARGADAVLMGALSDENVAAFTDESGPHGAGLRFPVVAATALFAAGALLVVLSSLDGSDDSPERFTGPDSTGTGSLLPTRCDPVDSAGEDAPPPWVDEPLPTDRSEDETARLAELRTHWLENRHPVADLDGNTLGYVDNSTFDSPPAASLDEMGQVCDDEWMLVGYYDSVIGAVPREPVENGTLPLQQLQATRQPEG